MDPLPQTPASTSHDEVGRGGPTPLPELPSGRKNFTPKFITLVVGLILLGGIAYAGIWYWGNQQSQVALPSATPDPTAGWKTYTNSDYGFSFKYPETFQLKTTPAYADPSFALNSHGFQIFLSKDGESSISMEIDKVGYALVTMDAQGSTASETESYTSKLIQEIIKTRSVIQNPNLKIYKHPENRDVRYSLNSCGIDYWESWPTPQSKCQEFDFYVYQYSPNYYKNYPVTPTPDPNFDFYEKVTEQILSTLKFTGPDSTKISPSPSSSPKPIKSSPATIPSISFNLQSEFLKNDPTAQAIASGVLANYDIRKQAYVYGAAGPSSTDNFGFRFLSAIRMLGYVKGSQTVGGQNMNEQILHRVESFNNLPASPYIDPAVLKIVDTVLVSRESLDKQLAARFPLTGHFINPPLNEPSSTHAAAVFSAVLGELPSSLVVWTEQNFKDYFSSQLPGRFTNLSSPNYQICDIAIYSELGDNCLPVVYSGVPLVNKIPTIVTDDFDNGTTIIHEYAHYLDRNLYPRNPATSQGLIDTTGFYSISYNLSDRGPGGASESGGSGATYGYKNPTDIKNEFVSAYAQGWQASDGSQRFTPYEDFAESFAMYVTEGKTFRKLAESSPILKEKYDWLKSNVFGNQEYQSGDIAGIAAIKAQPTATAVATGAFNTRDYSQALSYFVWNYKFFNGSLVPKP